MTAFDFPVPPEGAQSAVIFFEANDEVGEAFAFELAERPPPFTGHVEAIDVLFYDAPLAAIGLNAGPLESADEPNRPLPAAPHLYRALRGAPSSFAPAAERSPALAAKRIRALTVDACVALGGCYASIEAGAEDDCAVPCGATGYRDVALMPPMLEPCPPGWTPAFRYAQTVCEPPVRVEPSCPEGQIQHVDSAACTPLGPPCDPNDAWNPTLAGRAGRIHYVDDSAAGPGTGSRGDPYVSIATALTAASAGELVALAKGRYAGPVSVPSGVTLIGACPAETVIDEGIVVAGAAATVESLAISAVTTGIEVRADATIENVALIGDGSGVGIRAGSGVAIVDGLSAVRWRNAVYRPASGGAVQVRRAVIMDSTSDAIVVEGTGDATITDTAVGRGAYRAILALAEGGARLTFERIYLFSNTHQSINVRSGTTLIRDAVIRDTRLLDGYGNGVYQSFGTFEISRVLIEDAEHAGIWIFALTAAIRDVVLARVHGLALDLQDATTTLERVAITDVTTGVALANSGTVEATDISVDGPFNGIALDPTSELTAHRVRVTEALASAIWAQHDSTLTLTDVSITGADEGVTVVSAVANVKNARVQAKVGMGAYKDAMATMIDPVVVLDGFTVENCELYGLDFSAGGRRTVQNGIIRGNNIGARIDFNPQRGLERVEFEDNQQALEIAGDVPVR